MSEEGIWTESLGPNTHIVYDGKNIHLGIAKVTPIDNEYIIEYIPDDRGISPFVRSFVKEDGIRDEILKLAERYEKEFRSK